MTGINTTPQQIAPSRTFKTDLKGDAKTGADIAVETARVLHMPGDKLNILSGKRFREVREQIETPTPYVGVVPNDKKTGTATDVPNPDSPDGTWDPTQFMPRFVFDKAEDALPVSPDFDGNTNLDDNAPETAAGTGGHYRDGVIGGDQKLSSGFAVTQKGDYTVLTYSFYYAHNKGGEYHNNDYSTAQVYLKPGADGKLAPEYLSTSWHHGSVLTPWSEATKDADGRPIVGVNLGTHALEVRDSVPAEGLSIRGDGRAELDGEPIDQSLSFEAFQKNVTGARYLDPASSEGSPRMRAMSWGEAGLNPFLPEVYQAAPSGSMQLLQRGGALVDKVADATVDKAEGVVTGVVKKADAAVDTAVGAVKSTAGDVVDVADGAKDTLVDGARGVADKGKGLVKSALKLF